MNSQTFQRVFTITVFLSAILIAGSGVVRAQQQAQPQPVALSIDEAIKMAIENNPMLETARNEAAAARARARMTRAQRRPSLSATSFLTDGDMPGILSGPQTVMPNAFTSYMPQRFFDQNLMLMLPLDVTGRLSRETRAATLQGDAAAIDAERTRQDLVLEVRMAYYDALFQELQAGVFQSAVDVAQKQLEIDLVGLEVGKIPAFYVERDRAELAMNQQMLAETRSMAATARIRLAALLGLDPATPMTFTDALDTTDAGGAPEEFDVAKTPDVASARTGADAAQAGLDSSKRSLGPEVSLTLMSDSIYPQDDESMNGTTAALIVAFPLVDGGMRRSRIAENRAMRDAALSMVRDAELRARADFLAARLEYQTARKNIATAQIALKSAEENFRVAKIRYEAGKGILVEMLDALSALTRARVNRLRAIRDTLVARDMLQRVAGKL